MDNHLATLLSFPPHPPPPTALTDTQYNDGILQVLEALRKLQPSDFTSTIASGEHVLDVINPALNSAAYAYALASNLKSQSLLSAQVLFQKMTTFLESFDARQIRYVGKEYLLIIENVSSFARRSQQSELALIPIANAILRLDPSGSTFTSAHIILAKAALESQLPSLAQLALDQPILYLPGSNTPKSTVRSSARLHPHQYITVESGLTDKLRYQDVLEYFVLIGTIYIAMREWAKALEAFECAIVYPTKDMTCSKMTVEAYKKWLLVHLLHTGKAGKLPSMTSLHVSKQLHLIAKPYEAVASIFETASALRLKLEIEAGNQLWINDCNMGLMYLILSSYQKQQIRNLANIYRTISISEVTRLTTSAETGDRLPHDQATEVLVQELISDGSLQATLISGPSKVLIFSSFGPVLGESNVQLQLAASMVRLKDVLADVGVTDRRLTSDREYLKWASKQRKLKNSSGDAMDMEELAGWEDQALDGEEDLFSST